MVEAPLRAALPAPLRLTRRGRLVLLAALLVLLTGFVGLVAVPGLAASASGGGAAALAPAVVVQPGDTLWSIAQRHAPGQDPFDVVDEIRRLNRITDYTVHPGQRLALPRR
jgi:hypothetical protein